MAILAGMMTVLGLFFVPRSGSHWNAPANPKVYVDWIGGMFITVSLLLLTFARTEGNVVGWTTSWIVVSIVVSLLLVGVLVIWQWYVEHRLGKSALMRVSI